MTKSYLLAMDLFDQFLMFLGARKVTKILERAATPALLLRLSEPPPLNKGRSYSWGVLRAYGGARGIVATLMIMAWIISGCSLKFFRWNRHKKLSHLHRRLNPTINSFITMPQLWNLEQCKGRHYFYICKLFQTFFQKNVVLHFFLKEKHPPVGGECLW